MKRILSFTFSGSTLLQMSLLHAEPASLIPNPGLEQSLLDETPHGWRTKAPKLLPMRITDEAYDGSLALEVGTPQTGNGWVYTPVIKAQPGTSYRLSVALLARALSGRGIPFYGIRVYESDGGWNPEEGQPYLITKEPNRDNGWEWQIKEASFQTRENTKWLFIGFLVDSSTAGVLLIDDVVLQKE